MNTPKLSKVRTCIWVSYHLCERLAYNDAPSFRQIVFYRNVAHEVDVPFIVWFSYHVFRPAADVCVGGFDLDPSWMLRHFPFLCCSMRKLMGFVDPELTTLCAIFASTFRSVSFRIGNEPVRVRNELLRRTKLGNIGRAFTRKQFWLMHSWESVLLAHQWGRSYCRHRHWTDP